MAKLDGMIFPRIKKNKKQPKQEYCLKKETAINFRFSYKYLDKAASQT